MVEVIGERFAGASGDVAARPGREEDSAAWLRSQKQGPKLSLVDSHDRDYIDDAVVPDAKRKLMMSEVTREEMNAKIEAVEARLETRLVSMDGKLDNLLSEMRRVGETAREAKQAASNIKWNVLFAALGGVGITASLVVAFWAIGWQIAEGVGITASLVVAFWAIGWQIADILKP